MTLCNRELERKGSTPPGFLSKSADIVENKRVEFFVSAKKCKRVRKNMKKQEIVETIVGEKATQKNPSTRDAR